MDNETNQQKRVLIFGATGYIGNAVVAESVRQGYETIAITRSMDRDCDFHGAEVVLADITDPASLAKAFDRKIDIVISCLACHSGMPKDFDDIDYKATLSILNAALENGTEQFILLSAICVRKPDLPLQLAKLKMEDALIRSGIDYTIVRPTAYFWVFEAQHKLIKKGGPGFVIGGGEQAVHNPIAKEDLAEFLIGSIDNSERRNRIHIIGGPETPDNIITYRESLLMAFEALGKEPKIINIPSRAYMALIRATRFVGHLSRKVGVFSEFLHITYYYLHDDMRAPGYGTRTLRDHMLGAEQ
ncbi:MAG: NAD(P)H-binding protein [Gammaproteobacteria bacterium]|nr:NAD(P)H-binding protein [Gammaproteobacteria bacterium]